MPGLLFSRRERGTYKFHGELEILADYLYYISFCYISSIVTDLVTIYPYSGVDNVLWRKDSEGIFYTQLFPADSQTYDLYYLSIPIGEPVLEEQGLYPVSEHGKFDLIWVK